MASLLVDLGVICGAVIAVLTAVTLVSRLPPVQWVWRQLISGPLERFSTRIVKDGARQFHEEIVAPQITEIGTKVDELLDQSSTSWHADKAWIVSRSTKVEERQKQMIVGVVGILERHGLASDEAGVINAVLTVLNGMMDEGRHHEG